MKTKKWLYISAVVLLLVVAILLLSLGKKVPITDSTSPTTTTTTTIGSASSLSTTTSAITTTTETVITTTTTALSSTSKTTVSTTTATKVTKTTTTTSTNKTEATIAQEGGSYIDPRVEVGVAKWTSFAKYTLGNCVVLDRRTWGKQPTIEVYNDTCMRVTYINKQGEEIVFQVEPAGSEYINRFTILDDGTYVSQLFGKYS